MTHAVSPLFTVNGSTIDESEKVKYLGHIICSSTVGGEAKVSAMSKALHNLGAFSCVHSK